MWKNDKPAGARRIPPIGKGGSVETPRIKNHPVSDAAPLEESATVRRIPPIGKGGAAETSRIKNHPILDDSTR